MSEIAAEAGRPQLGRDVRVIGLVSTAHLMSHFYQLVLPSLFPILKAAFGVGYVELGVVMTLFYATSALMQTPAGLLVDRLGPARVLIGGLGLYGAAVFSFGLAPTIWVLAPLAVAAGIGNCVFHPSDYAIMTARVGARRLGRAYAVHNFAGAAGWALSPVVVLGLTSIFGWRAALSSLGALGIVLALYLLSQHALLTAEAPGRVRAEPRPKRAATGGALRLLLSWPIVCCFGYFALLAVAQVGLQPFLPSALVSAFGISVGSANAALTAFLAGSATGMFVGGIAADRFGDCERLVALGLSVSAAAMLAVAVSAMPLAALFACIAVAGFAFGSTTPSRDLLVRGATPAGATGSVFGFVYSGLDLGSAATPPFVGLLLDHHLPRFVFVFSAMILVLAIGAAWVVSLLGDDRRAEPKTATGTAAGKA